MRKPLVAFLAAAAVAAVAVPASTAAAQNTNLRVFVSNCEKQVYKPKTITVFCADAGVVIKKIKYSSYGAKTAAGTGTAVVNLCEPDCAAGKTKNYKVKLKLSRVTQCGDSYQFRKLQMTYTGAKPKGNRTINQSFPCADAPTR
jgi:hypothetical protein